MPQRHTKRWLSRSSSYSARGSRIWSVNLFTNDLGSIVIRSFSAFPPRIVISSNHLVKGVSSIDKVSVSAVVQTGTNMHEDPLLRTGKLRTNAAKP
jgi:hypothetical protein